MKVISISHICENKKYSVNGAVFFGAQIVNWTIKEVKDLIKSKSILQL